MGRSTIRRITKVMKNMQISNTTPDGADKIMRKPRPTTIYKRAIRSIMQAHELAGYIGGCDEARAKLVEAAESIHQKMEQMKQEAQTAKKPGKDKATAAEQLEMKL